MPDHRVEGWVAVAAVPVLAAAVIAAAAGFVRSAARGHQFTEDTVPVVPVALVLGAQVYPDGTPSRFLTARLELARRLYLAGSVGTILVSGDSLAPEWDEPAAMRRYLVDAGVAADDVLVDHAGFDTYDSCVRAKRVFGLDRVVMVTQAYHLPRAVGTARLVGLDAVGVGDSSVEWVQDDGRQRRAEPWRRGAVRDVLACVKTVLDLARQREPVLNLPEDRRSREPTIRPAAP